MIMHDQEIMDKLLKEHGEKAVEQFGDCLSDCVGVSTRMLKMSSTLTDYCASQEHNDYEGTLVHNAIHQQMINIINQVLTETGTEMRVDYLVGSDDDGYYWEVFNVDN